MDTSVWSRALRRDRPTDDRRTDALRSALVQGDPVVTTGLVVQELLQGVAGPKNRSALLRRLGALPVLTPSVADHIGAAEIRNRCRRHGVQLGTIDALIASLCINHRMTLLTADRDFDHAARFVPLQVWS